MEAISTPRLARYDMLCYDEEEQKEKKKKKSKQKRQKHLAFPGRGFPRNDVRLLLFVIQRRERKEKCRVPENLWRSLFLRF
jgi:hypothetical protein